MAKIKKNDINKLSKLEQQIAELKEQKKKQEEELARNIGQYFLDNIDVDELDSVDDLYSIIDDISTTFNNQNKEEDITKVTLEHSDNKLEAEE